MTIFGDILDQEISLILELNNHLSGIGEGHIKGTALEVRFGSLLKRFLPNNVNFARGWTIDGNGNKSDERDYLLYDTIKAPAFLFDTGTGIIPLISVLYDIQIKSKLTLGTIKQAYEKFDSRIANNVLIGNQGRDILKIYSEIDNLFYINPKINILLSEASGYYFFSIVEKSFNEIFDFENNIRLNNSPLKIDPSYDKTKIKLNGISLEELSNKKIKICRWVEGILPDSSKLKSFFIGLSNTLYKSNVGEYLSEKNGAIKYLSLLILDHEDNIILEKKLGEKNADIQNLKNVNLSLKRDGKLKIEFEL